MGNDDHYRRGEPLFASPGHWEGDAHLPVAKRQTRDSSGVWAHTTHTQNAQHKHIYTYIDIYIYACVHMYKNNNTHITHRTHTHTHTQTHVQCTWALSFYVCRRLHNECLHYFISIFTQSAHGHTMLNTYLLSLLMNTLYISHTLNFVSLWAHYATHSTFSLLVNLLSDTLNIPDTL